MKTNDNSIMDMRERMKSVLNKVCTTFNSNNRSEHPINGACIYVPTSPLTHEDSPGCAIGMFLTNDQREWILTEAADNIHINQGSIAGLAQEMNPPEALEGMPIKFLQSIQGLHDRPHFWNEEGLSKEGEGYHDIILEDIDGGDYDSGIAMWIRSEEKKC